MACEDPRENVALLQQTLSRNEALDILMEYEVAVVRLMFAKKVSHLGWSFPKGFTTGNCTEDKHAALLAGWLKHVETNHGLSCFSVSGVEDPSLTLGTSTSASASSSQNAKDAVFDVDTCVLQFLLKAMARLNLLSPSGSSSSSPHGFRALALRRQTLDITRTSRKASGAW